MTPKAHDTLVRCTTPNPRLAAVAAHTSSLVGAWRVGGEAKSTEPRLTRTMPYGATKRPRLVARIAEAGSVAGRGCSTSPQDMPDALHFLVLTVAGWANRPPEDQSADLREEQQGLWASCPEARSGPARAHVRPRRPSPWRCCMNTRCGWGGVARTSL